MPRPVHFEIHADDPARAIAFYQHVFPDWQFPEWMPGYWGVVTGADGTPGINGGLLPRPLRAEAPSTQPRPATQPVSAYVCTIEVDDLDTYSARAIAAGGGMAVEKHEIMGVGWQAYCLDTEGNIFGLHQDTSGRTAQQP